MAELTALARNAVALRRRCAALIREVDPLFARSATNLLHYLGVRREDIRHTQEHLAELGLSSLGRAEAGVLGNIHAVIAALAGLRGKPAPKPWPDAVTLRQGRALLHKHTSHLLGPPHAGRRTRVMVTMPTEAASDPRLARDLIAAGMDCARINAAHDDPARWRAMIDHVRRAADHAARPCHVLMDLPGPKLRTGPVEPGPRVVRLRPHRDELGRVERPARIYLAPAQPAGAADPLHLPPLADAVLPLVGVAPGRLKPGDRLRFRDARGKKRALLVAEPPDHPNNHQAHVHGVWAQIEDTAYVTAGMELMLDAPRAASGKVRVGDLPALERRLTLRPGDRLMLTRALTPGIDAVRDARGRIIEPARIGCTLPEAFRDAKAGEPIWLDDGKIGGTIRRVRPDVLEVEITHARPAGERLGADKGINLPESDLRVRGLTDADAACLPLAAQHADMVGLSFVRDPADVRDVMDRLAALGDRRPAVVLKIETRRAFERLPELLLAAMHGKACGVMIARGDLAVEVGYERLAEVQEEILWLCEAAHVPVIWATQVLDTLARRGLPTRAEVTDAAMAQRAECVMLNKGPFITRAVGVLDNILRRMDAHQSKKSARLRRLHLALRFEPPLPSTPTRSPTRRTAPPATITPRRPRR